MLSSIVEGVELGDERELGVERGAELEGEDGAKLCSEMEVELGVERSPGERGVWEVDEELRV